MEVIPGPMIFSLIYFTKHFNYTKKLEYIKSHKRNYITSLCKAITKRFYNLM